MIQATQNLKPFDKKVVHHINHFWHIIGTNLKEVSVREKKSMLYESKEIFIFHYSKNYGSPTRVTRLKIAVKMEGPPMSFGGQFVPLTKRCGIICCGNDGNFDAEWCIAFFPIINELMHIFDFQ